MSPRLSHPSHPSHPSHTSHSSHITATTEQIQALSLLRDEGTTSILAYAKHARSLTHCFEQGASPGLLSIEQLDAIGTLSSCGEDEVRTLLERPHASRKSSIHVKALHISPNGTKQRTQRPGRVQIGLALPPFLHHLRHCNALYQVPLMRSL